MVFVVVVIGPGLFSGSEVFLGIQFVYLGVVVELPRASVVGVIIVISHWVVCGRKDRVYLTLLFFSKGKECKWAHLHDGVDH